MRFQVPQFINIEDKIFGPFTVKQFVYLVGGAGMVYIVYSILPFYAAIFLIVPAALFALALAFVKPNGKPFVFMVQAAAKYFLSSRLYLWRRTERRARAPEASKERAVPQSAVPSLSESRLKELTWALDINQNVKKR